MTKFKNYRVKEYKKGIYLLNKNEGLTLEEFAKFGNMIVCFSKIRITKKFLSFLKENKIFLMIKQPKKDSKEFVEETLKTYSFMKLEA
mgnify:CR=1 FL=1